MKRLGYACDDTDRDERMRALNQIARTEGVASTSDFDDAELQALAAELGRHRNRNSHPALIAAAGGDGDG